MASSILVAVAAEGRVRQSYLDAAFIKCRTDKVSKENLKSPLKLRVRIVQVAF